jgi:hypothetical protein
MTTLFKVRCGKDATHKQRVLFQNLLDEERVICNVKVLGGLVDTEGDILSLEKVHVLDNRCQIDVAYGSIGFQVFRKGREEGESPLEYVGFVFMAYDESDVCKAVDKDTVGVDDGVEILFDETAIGVGDKGAGLEGRERFGDLLIIVSYDIL